MGFIPALKCWAIISRPLRGLIKAYPPMKLIVREGATKVGSLM